MTTVRLNLKPNNTRNLFRGIDLSKLNRQVRYFLFLDAIFVFSCIVGVYHLSQKADLPFSVITDNEHFIAVENSEGADGVQPGDTLMTFDGLHFNSREGLEVYLDSRSIGDNISISFYDNGILQKAQTRLIKFYTLPFIASNAFSGFLFIAFGIFVLLKCPELRAAKIFHWGSIGIAVMLLNTWGKYTMGSTVISIAARSIFHFSYVLTPLAFLHFSLAFPKDREQRFKFLIQGLYAAAVIIAVFNIYYFIRLLPLPTESSINDYLSAYFFNRILAIFNILAAISIFIASYFRTANVVEKKKLKWLILGFLIGPFSFIAFWTLPQLITSQTLMPEIFIPLLMLFIPLTFTIAIVRYHLMDIDLLIRRSIAYSIVIFCLVIIYIAVITIISSQILLLNNQTPSIIAAILVALLFQPIRNKVQMFVDKKFFRVQYDFRKALKKFIKDISEINTINGLAEKVVKETQEFIPVKKIGFFLLKNNRIRLIAHQNFDLLVRRSLVFNADKLKSKLKDPVADPVKIEIGAVFESADIKTFRRWRMDLVVPIRSGDGEIFGFLVLGDKKSESRFTVEDIDLLNNVASNIASTLSRIYFQEELIRKDLEAEKLEELNKQKTMFVSTVSHDLKTPLASIKMFSEILKSSKQLSEKQKNYLDIIEGEADRLTRLINNVLGFAWIEKGTRHYNFESVSLNEIVQKTLTSLEYQIRMQGFLVEVKLSPTNWIVLADGDAVMQALINVISNALKFSVEEKVISIITFRSDAFFCVEVRDKGIGINREDLRNLFKPFFRTEIAGYKKIKGTGLGLSIIKHVMDAHKGKIEVQSVPSEGTSFILKFPLEIHEDTHFEEQNLFNKSLNEEEG
jgi:signal transduction histidine kinase